MNAFHTLNTLDTILVAMESFYPVLKRSAKVGLKVMGVTTISTVCLVGFLSVASFALGQQARRWCDDLVEQALIPEVPEPVAVLEEAGCTPEPVAVLEEAGCTPEPVAVLEEAGCTPEPVAVLEEAGCALAAIATLNFSVARPEPVATDTLKPYTNMKAQELRDIALNWNRENPDRPIKSVRTLRKAEMIQALAERIPQ